VGQANEVIMEEKHVVTCFLEYDKRILLLRRSERVGTYRGRWAGISGYIEEGNTPYQQALEEIKEETGLDKEHVKLIREGQPLEVVDEQMGRKWIVHPFRFRVMKPEKIEMDWEHTELRWVDPEDIAKYETVPKLLETWERVVD
jgi:8-oxo-dGTP diphosphatase